MTTTQMLSFISLALLAACSLPQKHIEPAGAPTFVKEHADMALNSSAGDHEARVQEFSKGFLQGYLWPHGAGFEPGNAYELGLADGRRSRTSQSHTLGEVLPGYGYSAVSLRGSYSFGLEQFAFIPADSPAETWWLIDATNSAGSKLDECPRGVAIRGYLSPQGSYGHLERYEHLLVLESSQCLGFTIFLPLRVLDTVT